LAVSRFIIINELLMAEENIKNSGAAKTNPIPKTIIRFYHIYVI
jgi:hypothetical protein